MNMLEVKDLKTYFYDRHGLTKAVDGVSFRIEKGTVFGLVGGSGSGKTMTALSILRLVPLGGKIAGGEVVFNGVNLLSMDKESLRRIRGSRISIVFQEPGSAFNPVLTIGSQIMEALLAHQDITAEKARGLALEYLRRVHIPDPARIFGDYPHQLSGGTKQRAMIAMALVNSPDLVILDEPTTALDVTIQAQILELLEEIIRSKAISALFISHDLGLISRMCDEMAVMHSGRIVETGSTQNILKNPKEGYTISLLESLKALG